MLTQIGNLAALVFGRADGESERVKQAFAADEQAWERAGFVARLLIAAVVVLWLFWVLTWQSAVYYCVFVAILIMIGVGHLRVTYNQKLGAPFRGVLIAADFMVLTAAILFDNPLSEGELPLPLRLDLGAFDFYFVHLVSIGLTYSALRVLWAGIMASLCWCAAVWWVCQQPGVTTALDRPLTSVEEWAAVRADPMFVDLTVLAEQLAFILLVTLFLAVAVSRARRLVRRQVDNDRKRQNLARYLSPLIAERLEGEDNPLAQPHEQMAALLFADLRGFTGWAEHRDTRKVFDTLSMLMGRLTKDVFDNRGTLDKYAGDGLMASFGTPDITPEDPADAIRCAIAMQESVADWRQQNPDADLQLMIGVHFGPVMVGDIGADDRFEFAVLGNTVNVAARLEAATRQHGCLVLISEDTVEAAQAQSADDIRGVLGGAGARLIEAIPLKGRAGSINAYAIGVLPAD